LGAPAHLVERPGIVAARSLQHAADAAVALAEKRDLSAAVTRPVAAGATSTDAFALGQRAVRGLFSGGTFCYEAQLVFVERGLACRSNAPVHEAAPLDSREGDHTFVDFGDDDYTRGKPHPMIDPSQ